LAKCKLCSTILKATGGSTKGLHEHLKQIHSVNVLNCLTACDGLSFNVIAMSKDIRGSLVAMAFSQVPSAVATIKQHVIDYGQRVRSFVMSDMEKKKAEGQHFSLTFDVWMSTQNRRYMNINVHARDGEYGSHSLFRVHRSMPANKCVAVVEQRLGEFGLNLSKILYASPLTAQVL